MESVCFMCWSEHFTEVMKKEEDWGKERRKKKGRKKEATRRGKKEDRREQFSDSEACVFRLWMPFSKQ